MGSKVLAMTFKRTGKFLAAVAVIITTLISAIPVEPGSVHGNPPASRKVKDIIVYEDARFYAAFPSVVRSHSGEFLLAFRRAPERRVFGEKGNRHVDPNSYLVMVRSVDGQHWSGEPELIYAHPFGGSQDPCLLALRDGTLLCTSYGWAFVRPEGVTNLKQPIAEVPDGVVFLGGYILHSQDNGNNWKGPLYPPHVPSEQNYDAFGQLLPAYNRGALCEAKDGRIFWVVASSDSPALKKTSVHLMISSDKGLSWNYACRVATDTAASFNETSIYETPNGDLVAFLRTADMDDQACMARSIDKGMSFSPWMKMCFQGHPLHALRLPDNRVLLTYGYRHPPFGIRARILNPECTDFETAPEIILRDDGGNGDLGYPWSVLLDEHHVLVTYYFNTNDGPRHIAGTILEISR